VEASAGTEPGSAVSGFAESAEGWVIERARAASGVTPDIAYEPTLEDHRAGYVDYIASVSEALVDCIEQVDSQ
jgi:hypothetical protein